MGRGEDQYWGSPLRSRTALRPHVVSAVRDPLPGLQSNKVTYVDVTVRHWPEILNFTMLLPGRQLMIQTFVGFVSPNAVNCAAEWHKNCISIKDREMDV